VSIQAGRGGRPFSLSVVEILRPVKGPLRNSAALRSSLAFGEPLTGLALRISFPAFFPRGNEKPCEPALTSGQSERPSELLKQAISPVATRGRNWGRSAWQSRGSWVQVPSPPLSDAGHTVDETPRRPIETAECQPFVNVVLFGRSRGSPGGMVGNQLRKSQQRWRKRALSGRLAAELP
jgi:hypothetical protein